MGLLKHFLKHALYVRREEILNEGYLGAPSEYDSRETLVIREIEEKEREVLTSFYEESNLRDLYTEERIGRYFSNGCKCHVAMKLDRVVGHLWWGGRDLKFKYCDPALRFIGDRYNMGKEDIVAVDFFVLPEERGSGTSLEFMSKVWRSLHELGYNRCLGTVAPNNRGARWTYKLLGHRDLRKIVIHRIFNYFVLIDGKLYFSPHVLSS